MESMKQIYLLLICQGFYLGSVGQRWTFPSVMTILIDSCVEIPCRYHPARDAEISGTVWYLYRHYNTDLEVLNTKNSSLVRPNYIDRTSLVPGDNSCTLRIDPVRRGDSGKYYPGIAGDKESIKRYNHSTEFVYLHVTDKLSPKFSLPKTLTEGEATTLRCFVDHTCHSRPPSLQWSKPGQAKSQTLKIYDGSWREISELSYIPSYEDDGRRVLCAVSYLDSLDSETSQKFNIYCTYYN
ncbi:Schwann cell myelin protein-like [Leptodactylus fuscus]|uniref:Schwann cell myelin protein-like n=1 Tax=Leptodactylus fuscus TaxID=238119 RepID=UPI003F4EE6AF